MKSSKRFRSLTKKKAGSYKGKPPDRTSKLPRDQIRLILRIYWTDKLARRGVGKSRGTPGLYDRLAAEFGVSKRLIRILADLRDTEKKNRFKEISVENIQYDVKRRLRSRGAAI